MSRTEKFFKNSITTALYQIVVMIAGFITPRIMLSYYGSEINGLVTSVTQFISYFNLVEAGLASAAAYALYKPLAEEDNAAISSIVSASRRFYNIAGAMFFSLTAVMALIYPFFVKADALDPFMVGLLVLAIGASGALEFLTMSRYRVLLSADQRTYILSLATIAAVVINTAVIAVLSHFGANIVLVRTVALSSVFVRSAILMIYVKRNYKNVDYYAKPNNAALSKRWDALILQILGTIQVGAPVVIATACCSLELVSVYTVFYMVINGINGILSIFQSGLAAAFGEVIAKGEKETLQKSFSDFEYTYHILISVIYSITGMMLISFIKIYTAGVNDANYDVPLFGFLFVLSGILYNIKTPQSMLVNSAGLYKETKVQTIIQGVIMVVGGFALAPIWGLEGIIIASCLSNLYRCIDLCFFIPKYVTGLPKRNSMISMTVTVLTSVALILSFGKLFNVNPDNYFSWALWAVVAAVFATVGTLIVFSLYSPKKMRGVFLRVLSFLKRR